MTKRVRVECTDCGQVAVPYFGVTLRVCIDNQQWSYCFFCPSCRRATVHESSEPIVAQLMAAGMPAQRWHLTAELTESRPGGHTLTPDELLDFHLFLQTSDWFVDVAPDRLGWRPRRPAQ